MASKFLRLYTSQPEPMNDGEISESTICHLQ